MNFRPSFGIAFYYLIFVNFRPSFGIAFYVDGVVLRGRVPIGGSPQTFRRLYEDSGTSQNYSFVCV